MKSKIFYIFVSLVFFLLVLPPVSDWWYRRGARWLHIFLFALCLSYLLTPLFRYLAEKSRIVDYPDPRKIHSQPTPLMGGLAIYLAFLGAILSNYIIDQRVGAILLGATLLVGFGLWDDLKRVSARCRLLAQILATSLVIKAGVIIIFFPAGTLLGTTGNIFLTLLWIVGLTNAFNFIDGMDGLATGLGIIIASFMGIIAFQTGQPYLGWLSAAMAGSCLGFFPYNFRFRQPASIFLGDCGSALLGFVLASLAILGEWADHNPFVSLSTPILLFGVLIFDMTYINATRLYSQQVVNFSQWINYVGKDHLHHRLNFILKGHKRTVIFIFFLNSVLGIGAVTLRNASTVDALLIISQAIIVLLLITVLERTAVSYHRD